MSSLCGQFTKSAQSRPQLTFCHLQDQHDYDMYKRNGLTRSFFILQQILIKYSRVSINYSAADWQLPADRVISIMLHAYLDWLDI
jgi:hypothetical protein